MPKSVLFVTIIFSLRIAKSLLAIRRCFGTIKRAALCCESIIAFTFLWRSVSSIGRQPRGVWCRVYCYSIKLLFVIAQRQNSRLNGKDGMTMIVDLKNLYFEIDHATLALLICLLVK